jgi:GR25 family glycosyltransferase involved in LPS biosynthesis
MKKFLITLFITSIALADQNILDSPLVISLGRDRERYEATVQLMKQAGFTNIERFEAIDGFHTEDRFFQDLNIWKGRPGQKGCAASHLLIWKNLINSDKEMLFVCEDDMVPHTQFSTLFPLYWNATPDNFDIVMVGCHFIENVNSEDLIVSIPSKFTHAYIISKIGAQKLLDHYQEAPKTSKKSAFIIDDFICSMMKEKKLIYYCFNEKKYPDHSNIVGKTLYNGICYQNKAFDSTIDKPSKLSKLIGWLKKKKSQIKSDF